jgi:hypothetical protein
MTILQNIFEIKFAYVTNDTVKMGIKINFITTLPHVKR